MENAWKRAKGDLGNAYSDEFERLSLHYLRIFWPALTNAPRLLEIDRYGVDHCLPDDHDSLHFKVAVQVKGFKKSETLKMDQVDGLILPSIKKFSKSPITCDHYFLFHNRMGSNKEANDKIHKAMDSLIENGKAKTVKLWDLSAFIKDARNKLNKIIRKTLLSRADKLLEQHQSFFYFGDLYIERVPLRHSSWIPGIPLQNDLEQRQYEDIKAAEFISTSHKVRYSLLVGAFGIGKTTTVMQATHKKGLNIVYVPAHTITSQNYGTQGTHLFLNGLYEELDLLEGFPDETAHVLSPLMGATLGRIFRQPEKLFLLVIDGIDEHPFYATTFGLQSLTNALAELEIPIVLTARKEHYYSLAGNYESAMENLCKKGGIDRRVELMELGPWEAYHAQQVLEKAKEKVCTIEHDKAEQIDLLMRLFDDPVSSQASNLLQHPLFLHMTLDLIMSGVDWRELEGKQLIEIWCYKKIERDLRVPRLGYDAQFDISYYAEGMMQGMEEIARAIKEKKNDLDPANEIIEAESALDIAKRHLNIAELNITNFLTTSFLIPAKKRRGKILQVKFFHHAMYEFFCNR